MGEFWTRFLGSQDPAPCFYVNEKPQVYQLALASQNCTKAAVWFSHSQSADSRDQLVNPSFWKTLGLVWASVQSTRLLPTLLLFCFSNICQLALRYIPALGPFDPTVCFGLANMVLILLNWHTHTSTSLLRPTPDGPLTSMIVYQDLSFCLSTFRLSNRLLLYLLWLQVQLVMEWWRWCACWCSLFYNYGKEKRCLPLHLASHFFLLSSPSVVAFPFKRSPQLEFHFYHEHTRPF